MKLNANKFSGRDLLIVALILIIAFFFRLYKIDNPLADFYSSQQADTAAVARNFIINGINLLKPMSNNLSPARLGIANPQGLYLSEFPLYSAIVAVLSKNLPFVSLEVYGRLTTVFFSLILIVTLYLLLLKENGRFAAAVASLVYAVFPYFVFYSRLFLPYTMGLTCTFLGLLFLYYFSPGKNKLKNGIFFVLAVIFTACGLLISSYNLFYLLPGVYLLVKRYKWSVFRQVTVYLFFILSLFPLLLWKNYIRYFPEGMPILTAQNVFLKPIFFKTIFFERINNQILGGYLTFFLILGIIAKSKKQFFLTILSAVLTFILIFEGLNSQYAYYQNLILPVVAIFVGLGVDFVYKNSKNFRSPILLILISLSIFLFSFFMSYIQIKSWYNYPKDLVNIANIIQDLTIQGDKIITDTNGDTTLLYLTDRRGLPQVYKDLAALKEEGYSYFATMNKQTISKLKEDKRFTLVFSNEKFALFKL